MADDQVGEIKQLTRTSRRATTRKDECRGKLGSLQFCVKKGVGWKAGVDLPIVRPVRRGLDECPVSFVSLWKPKTSWFSVLGLGVV